MILICWLLFLCSFLTMFFLWFLWLLVVLLPVIRNKLLPSLDQGFSQSSDLLILTILPQSIYGQTNPSGCQDLEVNIQLAETFQHVQSLALVRILFSHFLQLFPDRDNLIFTGHFYLL